MRYQLFRLILAAAVAISAAAPAWATQRVALVIGNSSYAASSVLAHPAKDAAAIAAMLRRLDFDVVAETDLGVEGMRQAVRNFSRLASNAEVAVVFYAGHSFAVGGRNYLIPVDARLERPQDAELEALGLDIVMKQLRGAKQLQLVLLDAFPSTAFLRGAGGRGGQGLAPIEVEGNLVVASSANTAGAATGGGKHSPLTASLLNHLPTPRVDIRTALDRVREDVGETTAGQLRPQIAVVGRPRGDAGVIFWDPRQISRLITASPIPISLKRMMDEYKAAREAEADAAREADDVRRRMEQQAELDRRERAEAERRAEQKRLLDEAELRRKALAEEALLAAARRMAEEKAETERKAEAARRLAEEKARIEAERLARAEAQRQAREKAEADRLAKVEETRRAAEEKRLADERAKAEAKRVAEEQRRAAEEKRLAEERARAEAKRVADEKLAAEEARRVAEERARAEEARRVAAEQRRAAEEKRLAEERAKAEANRIAEEKRAADEARRVAEERARAEETRRVAEERARAEEARRVAEERARAEEALRVAEERRRAEERERAEEIRRVADERARRDELERQLLETRRLAEERARADEERERRQREQSMTVASLPHESGRSAAPAAEGAVDGDAHGATASAAAAPSILPALAVAGDRGEQIKLVQRRLAELRCYGGVINGRAADVELGLKRLEARLTTSGMAYRPIRLAAATPETVKDWLTWTSGFAPDLSCLAPQRRGTVRAARPAAAPRQAMVRPAAPKVRVAAPAPRPARSEEPRARTVKAAAPRTVAAAPRATPGPAVFIRPVGVGGRF